MSNNLPLGFLATLQSRHHANDYYEDIVNEGYQRYVATSEDEALDAWWDTSSLAVAPSELKDALDMQPLKTLLFGFHLAEEFSDFSNRISWAIAEEMAQGNAVKRERTKRTAWALRRRMADTSEVVLPRGEVPDEKARGVDTSCSTVPPSEFCPTAAVTQFWKAGMAAYLEVASLSADEDTLAGMLKVSEIQTHALGAEFARRFRGLLSTLGFRQKHGLQNDAIIANGGRFALQFQLMLLDRVQIIPDQSGEFFSALHRELLDYLKLGGALSGNWGRLELQGDEIRISAQQVLSVEQGELWKKARVIE